MRHKSFKPLVMGAVMGPIMLWMAHMILAGKQNIGFAALIGFIMVHIVFIVSLLIGSLWMARRWPTLWNRLTLVHRPSLSHVGFMIAGILLSTGIVHFALHGGLA